MKNTHNEYFMVLNRDKCCHLCHKGQIQIRCYGLSIFISETTKLLEADLMMTTQSGDEGGTEQEGDDQMLGRRRVSGCDQIWEILLSTETLYILQSGSQLFSGYRLFEAIDNMLCFMWSLYQIMLPYGGQIHVICANTNLMYGTPVPMHMCAGHLGYPEFFTLAFFL